MGEVHHIFSMGNAYSAEARWKLRTSSDGHQQVTASCIRFGICSGMVAVWIKKSIATHGTGIRSAHELGPVHFMGIVHSAYMKKTLFHSKEQDYGSGLIYLLQSQNLITQAHITGYGRFSPTEVIDWVLSKPGHYIFSLFSELGSHIMAAGHAIGFRHEGNHKEMFDPNYGLYTHSDRSAFIVHLDVLTLMYLHRTMRGPWYLHRVVSDTEPASLSGESSVTAQLANLHF